MIQPTYTTFEQSKLLKEKGFDLKCLCYYIEVNNNHSNHPTRTHDSQFINWNAHVSRVSCPEQWMVTEWLRVNHGIWIHSAPENNEEDIVKWAFTIQRIDSEVRFVRRVGEFNSPQEAYSAAFDYTLNNLV